MISPLYQALGPLGYRRAAPASSIYSLASHLWKLDEESDGSVSVPRLATIGGQNYTDNNTVASAAKGVGAPANLPANVASFVAASAETLTHANVLDFSLTWSFAVWIKVNGTVNFRGAYGGGPNSVRGYFNAGTFVFYHEVNGYTPSGFSATLDENWHLLQIWHDNSDDSVGCRFDGGGDATYIPRDLVAGTAFVLGNTPTGGNYFNGLQSVAAIWPVILTADQRSAVWNGGDGAPLP